MQIADVFKSFAGKPVLQGVSLELSPAEIVVILGPSGCGKSVLLKCVMGLIAPDQGKISFKDQELCPTGSGSRKSRMKIGMVFQSGALFDFLNVFENIALPLRAHTDLNEHEIRDRVDKTLVGFTLSKFSTLYPAELSGGMKRRVAMARTIITEPELILFDEPTVGLDPERVAGINELIVKLSRQGSVSCLAVTHDLYSAYRIADRVGLHHEGKIKHLMGKNAFFNSEIPEIREFLHGFKN
ncbi:MAG: ATP-binding cassette domain-containing protein [Candidatus Wallbacteria bacterium]|nr:ATP-binding cassette domain-containing protein [Candidatus Wallbacteria bacterium]